MKKWYQSKLVWTGVIEIALGALDLLNDMLIQDTITPSGLIIILMGVLTIVLRKITTTRIEN